MTGGDRRMGFGVRAAFDFSDPKTLPVYALGLSLPALHFSDLSKQSLLLAGEDLDEFSIR